MSSGIVDMQSSPNWPLLTTCIVGKGVAAGLLGAGVDEVHMRHNQSSYMSPSDRAVPMGSSTACESSRRMAPQKLQRHDLQRGGAHEEDWIVVPGQTLRRSRQC